MGLLARLQPGAAPGAHHGRPPGHQFRGRRAQSPGDRGHGPGAEAGEERPAVADPREQRDARPRHHRHGQILGAAVAGVPADRSAARDVGLGGGAGRPACEPLHSRAPRVWGNVLYWRLRQRRFSEVRRFMRRPESIAGWAAAAPAAPPPPRATPHAGRVGVGEVQDGVGLGIVGAVAGPGGNITGFAVAVDFDLIGKWLDLLRAVAPGVRRATLLYNPDTVPFYRRALAAYTESKAFTIPVTAGEVRTPDDVAATLTEIAREPRGGLIVPFDAFTVVHLPLVAEQALQHRLPSVSPYRQFAVDGGLLAYRPDLLEILRRPA